MRAAYTYLSLGCSKAAEQKMLAFARQQVGKPFSNYGMAMSVLYPRQSDAKSWFCAELVAAILKEGGLMSKDSNPGAATPHSLYKMYAKAAAATANPYTLRTFKDLSFKTMTTTAIPRMPKAPALAHSAPTSVGARRHADSPPRTSFRVIQHSQMVQNTPAIGLSFESLKHAQHSR